MSTTRVLIVDDDMPLAQSLKINLEETGNYEVKIECQSAKAVASARAFHPHLVLLDYIMPGMDGGDVSTRFREDPQLCNVPIIMVTALISNDETGETGIVHSNGHIMVAKPVKLEKLLLCIEKTLGAAG